MIEARGLVKHYRSTPAVDNLSFDVRPGTVTGFLGPNGAGKSTTMRMIMGLDRPDAGQVRIGGKSYGDLRWPLREVGALLEAKAFHPGRTARAHLTALAASNAIGRQRVEEVLVITGIEKVADRRAGKFSLGMSQRLGIAAALLGDPRVLLLDEPVNGLDPEGIRWIRNLLKNLVAQGSRPEAAREALADAIVQTREALDELRALSRGIAPPVLVDRGLREALTALAARSTTPVELDAGPLNRRLDAAVETAAYFVIAEALTNVAKHSHARRCAIGLRHGAGTLRVWVTDDGAGGAALDKGHGLRGLDDRLHAAGGRLRVTSPCGGPTTITAELPCC